MFYPSGHGNCLTCCDISPDGAYAVSGGGDGTARIWNLQSGQEVGLLCANREPVVVVKYSPQGDHVLTGDICGKVRIWDPVAETICATLEQPTAQTTCAAFSSDGGNVLVGYDNGLTSLWNIATATRIRSFALGEWDEYVLCDAPPDEYQSSVVSCDLSPDGNLLFAISNVDAMTIGRVVNVRTGETLQSHWLDSVHLCGAVFILDSKGVLIRVLDGTIKVINITKSDVVSYYDCTSSIFFNSLYFGYSPCRRRIVFGGAGRGYPQVVDAASNERLQPLQDPMTQQGYVDHDPPLSKDLVDVKGCAISHDGTRILAMSHSDHRPGLRLWDVGTSAVAARLEWSTVSLFRLAISPDGSMLCVLGKDRSVRLLRLDLDAAKLNRIKMHLTYQLPDALYQCGFSPNGLRIFVSTGHEIEMWTTDGRAIATITGWKNPAYQLGLKHTADVTHFISNHQLVTVDLDRGAQIIDLRTDESVISLTDVVGTKRDPRKGDDDEEQPSQPDTVIKWMSDSGRKHSVFLTASGVVKRMDISSQQIEATYDAGSFGVKDVDLSSDGIQLVCLTNSGELQLLDTASLTVVRRLCEDWRAESIQISPCGTYLLVTQANGAIYVERLLGSSVSHRGPRSYGVAAAQWHPSGKWVCTAGTDGVIRLWTFDPDEPEFSAGPFLSFVSGREWDQSNWASWTEDGQWAGSGPVLLELIRRQKPAENQPRQTAAETMHSMAGLATHSVAP